MLLITGVRRVKLGRSVPILGRRMRAHVQRISHAAVRVDERLIAEIGPGLLVLLGVSRKDDTAAADRLAEKVRALRVFPDGHAARANRMPVGDLGPTAHFEHMMEIYGGYGERVETPEALPAALERAIHAVKVEKRQALLNLIVGPRGGAPT